MTVHNALKEQVATACRILAARGLVEGALGHVSVRTPEDDVLVRCRGPEERGLARTVAADVRAVTLDGTPREPMDGWQAPVELPIHTELYRRRPEVRAVVHAHPPAALLCGLAGLAPRPVFGAYNIPALSLALEGVPVYPRSVLISRSELAEEMVRAMGSSRVCLLRGHGITVGGASVEEATVTAVNLEVLCRVTVQLHCLGSTPPSVPDEDLAELPDLGGGLNTVMAWQALAATGGVGPT
jgi:ribulose-5-phosphate 4-epimerase/fuculose-1-phosphate aldolase